MDAIHNLRVEYKKGSLDVSNVGNDPIAFFKKWFDEALNSNVLEANAMVLSTISPDYKPHSRVVLVKGISEDGFTFFTNYNSNKGKQMSENEKVSLLFFWPELERQVRIEGVVSKVAKEISESYFHSRPRSSQIGAHVSPQSSVIGSREVLEQLQIDLEKKFDNQVIPLPNYWGGYLVNPEIIEFWQGRPSRLHDRIQFTKLVNQSWKIERLAP